MIEISQWILIFGLVSLVGGLVLVLPLLYLVCDGLRPWFETVASERLGAGGLVIVRQAPLARRTAARGGNVHRKLAVSPEPPGRSRAKKKVAKKAPKAAAKKRATAAVVPRKKVAKKKAAAKKKPAAAKSALPKGAERDSEYGVIFAKRPAAVDDLKKISGVGKVIEGKLHTAGIYTYRQIADWKVAQVAAFEGRLSFKGRIGRDGWKKQAAALIKAKRV